jgi:outer membrane protein TolC
MMIGVLTSSLAWSQNGIDSTQTVFKMQSFIDVVRSFHPVVKQAQIGVDMAKAARLAARGAFDPAFYLSTDQKTFDGKNYFIYTNPELKIPTWYGVEVKAGLENNGGLFTSDEISLGKTSYLGVSVPLAKNLVMDKRRAALQQAKIFVQQSEADRLIQVNDILLDAYIAYLDWQSRYQFLQVVRNAVEVNAARFNLVKIAYRQGDRPAIDTVEALAQLQNFQFLEQEAMLRFRNAGVDLSNFLWLANDLPYQLPTNAIPEPQALVMSQPMPLEDELLQAARQGHPKLQSTNFKLQSLEVERKLKFQSLLPTFNVKTNLLNKGYNVLKGVDAAFFENNYKFGIDLGMPLRLSEGRGEYRRAKLKLRDTRYDFSLLEVQIANKVRIYYNEIIGFRQQVNTMDAALRNYQTLLRGEDVRFRNGESSLFILNARENKVLETQQKVVELIFKYSKSLVSAQWAAGQLR